MRQDNVLIMTPEEITEIKQYAQGIAAILYAQTDYVAPEIGIFLSAQQQKQRRGELDTSKVYSENYQ